MRSGDHPTEEQLMEAAFTGATSELQEHLKSCPTCASTVHEFKEVRNRVASLEEEDVPVRVQRRILNVTRHGHPAGLLQGLQSVVANPFLIALVVALVVIFLYFLVGSEVFKIP
jgi:anti-sigma factor RsiW